MHNAFRVYVRDLKRIARVPASWVIIFGLTCIPALYSWVNVWGFWDPYHNTSGIVISVVNEDQGGYNELTGELKLGDQIVSALEENNQLAWTFETRDDALEHVKSAQSYAAIIIPSDFTSNLLTILTGDFTQPTLEYYVNEKANAAAPKVTDVGATTVDRQINDTFVATVSKTVADAVKDAAGEAGNSLGTVDQTATASLTEAAGKVGAAVEQIQGIQSDLSQTTSDISRLRNDLTTLSIESRNVAGAVTTMSTVLTSTSNDLSGLSSAIGSAYDTGSQQVNNATQTANTTVQQMTDGLNTVNGKTGEAIDTARGLVATEQAIVDALDSSGLADLPDVRTQINAANAQIGRINATLNDLAATQQAISQASADTADLSDDMASGTSSAINTTTRLKNSLATNTVPALTSGIAQLGSQVGEISSLGIMQGREIDMLSQLLDQMDSTLTQLSNILGTTGTSLTSLQNDLTTASSDVSILANSQTWKNILNALNLDSSKISDFMSSPTELTTETLFPVATYGSSMVPLFTCLTMWIGSLMLVIILKLEVDDEGIENLTVRQRFMGRWLLMATLSVIQAVIVSVGLIEIGAQVINQPLFVLSVIIIGLVFLSIVYSLSACFMHVGIGVSIVLVFIQIPGSSGIYPIDLMPSFFQHLYPLFPFTHGGNLLRETIAGFYGHTYVRELSILFVFAVIAFVFGLVLRPYLTNVTRVFYDELAATHIMMGEQSATPERRYKLTQMITALASRDEFREAALERARKYEERYPRLLRGGIIAGFIVPAVLSVFSALNTNRKVVFLALWVLWVILIIGFLLTIEVLRDSVQRQAQLINVGEDELRNMVYDRTPSKNHHHDTQDAQPAASASSPPQDARETVPAEVTATTVLPPPVQSAAQSAAHSFPPLPVPAGTGGSADVTPVAATTVLPAQNAAQQSQSFAAPVASAPVPASGSAGSGDAGIADGFSDAFVSDSSPDYDLWGAGDGADVESAVLPHEADPVSSAAPSRPAAAQSIPARDIPPQVVPHATPTVPDMPAVPTVQRAQSASSSPARSHRVQPSRRTMRPASVQDVPTSRSARMSQAAQSPDVEQSHSVQNARVQPSHRTMRRETQPVSSTEAARPRPVRSPQSQAAQPRRSAADPMQSAVNQAIQSALHDAIADAVRDAVQDAIRDAVRQSVSQAVNDTVRGAVADALSAPASTQADGYTDDYTADDYSDDYAGDYGDYGDDAQ